MSNTTVIRSLNLQVFLKSPMKPTEFPKECIPVKCAPPSLQQHCCSPASLCTAKPGDEERSGHRNPRRPCPGGDAPIPSPSPGSCFVPAPATASLCVPHHPGLLPFPATAQAESGELGFSVISVQHSEAASPGSCLLPLLLPCAGFSFSHLLL